MRRVGSTDAGVGPRQIRTDTATRIREATAQSAAELLPRILQIYAWPLAQLEADSPQPVAGHPAALQYQCWLRLWSPEDIVWIGDVYSSGKPHHARAFRTAADWAAEKLPRGNYTCGATFKPGSYARSNENIVSRRFMIVESDTLSKDQVGAIFRYLSERLDYRLHCIIDTGGKSLHGWFTPPDAPDVERNMKALLTGLQCDPKTLTFSQPVRVPGALRDGKPQKLIWLA